MTHHITAEALRQRASSYTDCSLWGAETQHVPAELEAAANTIEALQEHSKLCLKQVIELSQKLNRIEDETRAIKSLADEQCEALLD